MASAIVGPARSASLRRWGRRQGSGLRAVVSEVAARSTGRSVRAKPFPARRVHGHSVEQPHQIEDPVHLAIVAACDCELTVLGLEPPHRIEQDVYPGRVHERDLAQIDEDRTALVIDNGQQCLPQQGRRAKVNITLDAEHGGVPIVFVRRQLAHRERGIGYLFLKIAECVHRVTM